MKMSKQKEQLFIQYTNWVIKAKSKLEINDCRYRMLKKRAKTSLQYWQMDGVEFPAIRAVALTVFSMVASSAASERGFSTMGFVHSKMRNRLGSEGQAAGLHQSECPIATL
jgi:hypothetical protein